MWLLDSNAIIRCLKHPRNAELFPPEQVQTTIFNVIEHPPVLHRKLVSVLYPTFDNYTHCVEYAIKLREKGTPLPAVDILIATIAIDENACLVTDDVHFESVQDITSSLKIATVGQYIAEIIPDIEESGVQGR